MELEEKNGITVSVILPVYNVEPWIDTCIESLKKQKLPGLEFIFVDDCSTDSSLAKIKAFAEEDPRVIVLHNEVNLGTGPSRNRGIEAANGEYLSFVDPDDWIADDFLELLYSKALETKCIIVKGVRITIREKANQVAGNTADTLNKQIAYALRNNIPLFYAFTSEHQTAIYKRSFIVNRHRIRYGTSSNAQDTTFLLELCLNTESIAFENQAEYYYVLRKNSATGGYTLKRSWGELKSLEEQMDIILDYPLNDYIYKRFARLIKGYSNNFHLACLKNRISDNEKVEYIQSLKKQIKRLPNIERITEDKVYIDAILSYNQTLPSKHISKTFSYTDCLNVWIDFLAQHPDVDDLYIKQCAYIFAKVLGRTILDRRNHRGDKIKKNDGVFNLLNRLDKKTKNRVLSFIPRSLALASLNSARRRLGLYV